MVVIRLLVTKWAGFFPIYRHIIVVLTHIISVSIWVYQCIKSGSELSKLLIANNEKEILYNYLELGKQVLSSELLQKIMFTLKSWI